MKEYSSRRNLNRGYMKLDVWQKTIELYKITCEVLITAKVDLKIRAQIADAAQSVSANIAEGYSRRSINEYMQHLYISLGSLSELLSRLVALREANQITADQFERIDALHYEVENKLWNLLKSLEAKKESGTWISKVSKDAVEYKSH